MPLQSPDEGRYAEAAREMLETSDWLIPHFGYVERVNKPPLFYWAAAASMRLFGVNEIAARLPSLLAALLTAMILYLLGRKAWDKDAGWAAALVLLTSLFFAALARTAITDTLLCLCLTAAVSAFWWAVRDRSIVATLLFFAAAAAGTLTKGPVALALPGVIGLLYLAFTRQWGQVRWGAVAGGVLLYVVLAAPWYIAVQAQHPGFLYYFFVGENLQRFAGNEHPEPPWFYLPILVLGFGVWIPSLIKALISAGRGLRELPRSDSLTLFALLWAGVIFAFFSISKGKLPTYIVPCFPPLALLIGRQWSPPLGALPANWTRWCAGLVTAGLALTSVVAGWLIPRLIEGSRGDAGLFTALALGTGAAVTGYATMRGVARTRFVAMAAAGALLTIGAADAGRHLLSGNGGAAVAVANAMVTQTPPETRLYIYREDGLTALRFYLGRSLGSSKRLQDIPALERPPINEKAAVAPPGGRRRNTLQRRRTADNGTSPSRALTEAFREPGPVIVVMRRKELARVRQLLTHLGAVELALDLRTYVVFCRLDPDTL